MHPLYSIIQKMKKKTAVLPLSCMWCYKFFWVKVFKLFPFTWSWNWYTFLYTILHPTMQQIILNSDLQQWQPQYQYNEWGNCYLSPMSQHQLERNTTYFQLEPGMHLGCVKHKIGNQSDSGTHQSSFYSATPTPSTAAAIDAEASSRVLFFSTVLKASRMSPSSQSSKPSNPSPHSRPAFTCSQGRNRDSVFRQSLQ